MNHKHTILLIEDEKNICNFIETTLTNEDYKVLKAHKGKEGLSILTSCCPDLVLLDLGLPDMDGLEVLRQIRSWSSIPVIIISARTQETEKVNALDSGADDYITKPFGNGEMLARIRTALRHKQALAQGDRAKNYRYEELAIDFDKRLVLLGEEEVHLTQIEYKLVSLLAQNAGKVMTYDTMISQIWGPYADSDNQILRVNMAHIRRKLEKNPASPKFISTEIGVGYRMKESE